MRKIGRCPRCGGTNRHAEIGLDGLWNIRCGDCGFTFRRGFESYNVALISWNVESRIRWDDEGGD